MDVTDSQSVNRYILDKRPDIIVHTAAVTSTAFCDENESAARNINVEGALNVARAAKKVDASLVFLSTEQVFNGNPETGPYRETNEPLPNTVYGKTKLEAEKEILKIIDKVWILRFTWLFGYYEEGLGMSPGIFWDTLKALKSGEIISASDDEFRGMTYVKYVTDQFEKIFDLPYDIYHLGSSNNLSRYKTLIELARLLGYEDDMVKEVKKPRRDIRLDCSKLSSYGIDFPDTIEGLSECAGDYSE